MSGLSDVELLKLRLMADGIVVEERAHDAWLSLYGGPLTLAEYATTSGISIVLPGEIYVNAPPAPEAGAPTLRFDDDFFVTDGGTEYPVRVIPVPQFHESTYVDEAGNVLPRTNLGVTHTDRCRVSPIEGCAWRCTFCDLPYEFAYRRKNAQDLLDLIVDAKDDPAAPARHVLVSGGTPRRGEHERWIDDVYRHLAERSPLPVDVMMPPRDLGYPEWLRSIGVNMLSVNLEVSDPERAREIVPVKSKRFTRAHFLDYVERAVEAFGVGFVQSLLVFGEAIETLESTLEGVRDLVERGCVPVLSAFRPHPSTPLGKAGARGATVEEMVYVYAATLDICDKAGTGVLPGPRCVPCHHNTVAFPDGSGFYVGLDADLTDRCLAS